MKQLISRFGRAFYVSDRRLAYRQLRETAWGRQILLDIMEFTRGLEPAPKSSDNFEQGRAADRRDVFLHVVQFCHLTEDELFNIYAGRPISAVETKENV